MSSRMVKLLVLVTVLLLAFPVVAGASTARIQGLGTQGDYIKDYTNIFTYPSCVPAVGNLVYGEFGVVTNYDNNWNEYFTTEDRSVGAVLGNLFDGKFGTFGFHMREYSPALGTNFQPYVTEDGTIEDYFFNTGFETFSEHLDPNVPGTFGDNAFENGYGTEAFDLMWGKKFDKISAGLRLNRSAYKYTSSSGGSDQTYEGYEPDDRNILGFGFGLGFENSATLQSEVGILYQSRTFSWENSSGDKISDNGGGTYLASGRMLWQWEPNVLVVPVVRLYSFDMSTKSTPAVGEVSKVDAKLSGWQAGVAGNWTLNQNDLFVAGVTFASNVMDQKTAKIKDTESLMPTMFAALETHVNSWLTLRFGGRKGVFYSVKHTETVLDTETSESTKDEWKESWSPFQFFMGTGVKLGTLQLDATLAQDFFHNPATYITGSPNGQNTYSALFPKVTATYTF